MLFKKDVRISQKSTCGDCFDSQGSPWILALASEDQDSTHPQSMVSNTRSYLLLFAQRCSETCTMKHDQERKDRDPNEGPCCLSFGGSGADVTERLAAFREELAAATTVRLTRFSPSPRSKRKAEKICQIQQWATRGALLTDSCLKLKAHRQWPRHYPKGPSTEMYDS